MHIDSFLDVINACRFCFMCRHIDTTASVSFRESDIPRGRALILDRVRMNGLEELSQHPDFVTPMYDCALSAACRYHCVSHYDETGLVLAARRDIVEAGLVPADVQALADALAAADDPVLSGSAGDVLYVAPSEQAEVSAAFSQLMKQAGVSCRTLQVSQTGKALAVLGFSALAAQQTRKVRDAILASGCGTVVTSCPATFDALKNDCPGLDSIDVQHASTYLLGLSKDGKLPTKPATTQAYYIDSDFLRNYNDIMAEPRELLTASGYTLISFGTNPEESYGLGEGAVVLDRLRPALVQALRQRLVELMDSPDSLIITASPYTRRVLSQCEGAAVRVLSLEEALLA